MQFAYATPLLASCAEAAPSPADPADDAPEPAAALDEVLFSRCATPPLGDVPPQPATSGASTARAASVAALARRPGVRRRLAERSVIGRIVLICSRSSARRVSSRLDF